MSEITSVSRADYFLKHSGAILKFEFGGGGCLSLAHWLSFWHRIDTRPEGTLLCVLAEGKRPKFFYVL